MDNLLHFLHLWYNNMTFLSVDGFAYRRSCAGVPSGLYNTQYLDSFGNVFLIVDSLIEFGFTDNEIQAILLFVLGDDNTGMTNIPYPRLTAFVTFMETYALSRYNMVLSRTKSVITNLRSKIETLGYRCNYGQPRRSIDKLVAQLCYPEHGIKYSTMSSRAIGIAIASCGQDSTFHNFCRDVYLMFLPFHAPTEASNTLFRRMLLRDFEETIPFFDDANEPTFPSLMQVRDLVSTYQGPLSYAPKWNYAHFINAPDVVPPSAKTMHEYELEYNIQFRSAPTFMH